MRSARTAFDMLESVNTAFQGRFPVKELPRREGEVVAEIDAKEAVVLPQ